MWTGKMKPALALMTICAFNALLWCPPVQALDQSLDVSQYAHTAWTVREGFSLGSIYAMAQTLTALRNPRLESAWR